MSNILNVYFVKKGREINTVENMLTIYFVKKGMKLLHSDYLLST